METESFDLNSFIFDQAKILKDKISENLDGIPFNEKVFSIANKFLSFLIADAGKNEFYLPKYVYFFIHYSNFTYLDFFSLIHNKNLKEVDILNLRNFIVHEFNEALEIIDNHIAEQI